MALPEKSGTCSFMSERRIKAVISNKYLTGGVFTNGTCLLKVKMTLTIYLGEILICFNKNLLRQKLVPGSSLLQVSRESKTKHHKMLRDQKICFSFAETTKTSRLRSEALFLVIVSITSLDFTEINNFYILIGFGGLDWRNLCNG